MVVIPQSLHDVYSGGIYNYTNTDYTNQHLSSSASNDTLVSRGQMSLLFPNVLPARYPHAPQSTVALTRPPREHTSSLDNITFILPLWILWLKSLSLCVLTGLLLTAYRECNPSFLYVGWTDSEQNHLPVYVAVVDDVLLGGPLAPLTLISHPPPHVNFLAFLLMHLLCHSICQVNIQSYNQSGIKIQTTVPASDLPASFSYSTPDSYNLSAAETDELHLRTYVFIPPMLW